MAVKAVRVDDTPEQPGEFQFTQSYEGHPDIGMIFMCPCGCGELSAILFRPHKDGRWTFDGNRDSPTVTPSIARIGGCRWHGHLINGEFVIR